MKAVFLATGDIAEAIRIYERALTFNPRYPDALYNLGVASGEVVCFRGRLSLWSACPLPMERCPASCCSSCGLSKVLQLFLMISGYSSSGAHCMPVRLQCGWVASSTGKNSWHCSRQDRWLLTSSQNLCDRAGADGPGNICL